MSTKVLTRGFNWFFRKCRRQSPLLYKFRHVLHRFQYPNAPPLPYEIVLCNPQDINHLVVPRFEKYVSPFGTHVIGGGWDQVQDRNIKLTSSYTKDPIRNQDNRFLVHFDNYSFYQSVEDHFTEGVKWENTEFYKWAIEWIKDSNVPKAHYYGTPKKIRNRLYGLDKLYNHMQKNGYLTQKELRKIGNAPLRRVHNYRPEHHEVMVDITRSGTIALEEGRHRLAIAKILNLEEIPVRVFVRHRKWQSIREKLVQSEINQSEDIDNQISFDHPDIRNLHP